MLEQHNRCKSLKTLVTKNILKSIFNSDESRNMVLHDIDEIMLLRQKDRAFVIMAQSAQFVLVHSLTKFDSYVRLKPIKINAKKNFIS